MLSQTIKRFAAAAFVGGALTLAPVAMPAANAAPPADCPAYAVSVTTTTSLSISPSSPGVGDSFDATATVNAGGAPATGGTVTFSYDGETVTEPVSGGTAMATFVVDRPGQTVSASYSGQCLAGSLAVGTSGDAIVAGVAAGAGGNGNGNGNQGGVAGNGGGSTIGGLASTGVDTQTELFGLLGLGLVTVGGLSLMVHRRRSTQG